MPPVPVGPFAPSASMPDKATVDDIAAVLTAMHRLTTDPGLFDAVHMLDTTATTLEYIRPVLDDFAAYVMPLADDLAQTSQRAADRMPPPPSEESLKATLAHLMEDPEVRDLLGYVVLYVRYAQEEFKIVQLSRAAAPDSCEGK